MGNRGRGGVKNFCPLTVNYDISYTCILWNQLHLYTMKSVTIIHYEISYILWNLQKPIMFIIESHIQVSSTKAYSKMVCRSQILTVIQRLK